jgi:hypothetical protein
VETPNRGSADDKQNHPAQPAHEDDRDTDCVQHVHAEKIGPRCPPPRDCVFLNPKQEAKAENFSAAEDDLFPDLGSSRSFLLHLVCDQGDRDPGEKKKQRCRKSPAQMRPHGETRIARCASEPRVVAMGLEHQDTGKPAQPINIGKA